MITLGVLDNGMELGMVCGKRLARRQCRTYEELDDRSTYSGAGLFSLLYIFDTGIVAVLLWIFLS